MSHSSLYLPPSNSYIYITGLLFYEEISNFINININPDEENKQTQPKAKRIGIPKILTLVSKKPLYRHMLSCLNKIHERIKRLDVIPLENMITNLWFETANLNPLNNIQNRYWRFEELNMHNMKSDYFFNIFMLKEVHHHIPKLLEKMIFGIPIILLSNDQYSLVCMTEVLKTLLFPFEFQGLIIPFESKPQVKLLTSSVPFLIGMGHDSFVTLWEPLGKQLYEVYDLDEKDFKNLQISSRIVLKLQNQWQIQK